MNELALFAGAGGGILGGILNGWKTICAVENNEYCQRLLMQRQNDGIIKPFPIWGDIKTFETRDWLGSVDIVTGGFPCQAFSKAAAGRNNAEDLWPEMFRVIKGVAPKIVFAENVSKAAIDVARCDIESINYKTEGLELSAADMGADHIRPRYWLFAYADNDGQLLRELYAKTQMLPKLENCFWNSDPTSAGVADGMAYRMERIRATGNGQVPIVVAAAWRIFLKKVSETY